MHLTKYNILTIAAGLFLIFVVIVEFWPSRDEPLVLGADGFPTGKVTWEFVSSKEEAELDYPNAETYIRLGSGQVPQDNITGWSIAFGGAILTSSSTPDEIYAWYRDWLLVHGWKEDPGAIIANVSGELSHQSYSRNGGKLKAREVFNITMWRPEAIASVLGMQKTSAPTIFEYRYSVKSNDQLEAALDN